MPKHWFGNKSSWASGAVVVSQTPSIISWISIVFIIIIIKNPDEKWRLRKDVSNSGYSPLLIFLIFLKFICLMAYWGFPGGSVSGEESTWNSGDACLISESGRSTGGEPGNPLHYSCQENPTDRGTWQATVHEFTGSDTTKVTEHAMGVLVYSFPVSSQGIHSAHCFSSQRSGCFLNSLRSWPKHHNFYIIYCQSLVQCKYKIILFLEKL